MPHRPTAAPIRRFIILVQLATFSACADSRSATDNTDLPAVPTSSAITAHAASTATNGKIAFVSNRDGNDEIYVMQPDGSGQTRLTNDPLDDEEPAWSPDGTKLAFRRNVLNADGGAQGDIYVMNADGSGQRDITNNPDLEFRPAWSPDGTTIAFDKTHDSNDDVYVVKADGTALTRLTTDDEPDLAPAWSPDGTKIAFVSLRDDPGDEFFKDDLFVMNADGTNQTNLTNSTAQEDAPAWSPDGTKIAYWRAASRTALPEIFVMNPDGSGQTNLTNNTDTDYEPAWSPDGTRLAFYSGRSGSFEIWTMNPDGSSPSMVTNAPRTGNISPAWQPIPVTPPYSFTGFFQPVDNLPTVNVAKAGRGIPVKFSLGGDQGLDIFGAGSPKFVAEPCDPSDQQDPLEVTTDSPSGLTYDATSGQYTYVWKTGSALAGRCGRLQLGLKDGSDHAALFRFTR
jgi:Tol biopolymer transport system component